MSERNLLTGIVGPTTQTIESGKALAEVLEEHDRDLSKMPASYRRMVRIARDNAEAEPMELIHKGGFKPCLPEEA